MKIVKHSSLLVPFAATALVLGMPSKVGASGLPPFKIVHLGDSYSAGNGARDEDGDENWHSVSGCYRSPTNWGSQFANSLGDIFSVTYINRACSGGVLQDITNERELDSKLKGFSGCPTPDFPEEEIIRDTSLLFCTRYLRPQIEAIDSTVDLVLMTIGGNDAGFDTIVKQCFALGYRDAEDCEEAVDAANDVLDILGQNLTATFAEIRSRLKPEARVVLVAYPHLLMDVVYALNDYNASTAVRTLSQRGDMIQQGAVDAANAAAGEDYIVYYNFTKELFETHEPNPSVLAENPDGWINEFFDGSIKEWYHFNSLGHQNLGSALSILETFGAVGGSFENSANIDLVFVVDTTGSMAGEIAEVRNNLEDLVDQLAAATSSFRVAVVSYRDFPERSGSGNYPSRVDQTFTNSLPLIQAGIDSLQASGGGDFAETVFSGIQEAIDLPWRAGVTKIAVVIGDAPALVVGGAEPISGLTASQIVAESIAVDPVQVIGVNVGSLVSAPFQQVFEGTGGTIISGTSSLTTALSEIIESASTQPFAWFGFAYSGKVGAPIVFDASGSFDPQGNAIDLYEWDFDDDGVFDFSTVDEVATHVFSEPFDGFVVLRVTSVGGSALASARTTVNEEGFVAQGNEACEQDEFGVSIISSESGTFLNCFADSLPATDGEGVVEITEEGCFTCEGNNPCTPENIANNGFYFPHCVPTYFVQCDNHGGCFDRPCAPGTEWDESINGCNFPK